jgi:hypothetical protein
MDQAIAIQTPTQKIYKNNAVRVGTFLGGPLVAGYFIAENFKAFNEPEKARKTWIYTILATIVIFAIAFAIPGNSRSGEYLIPLIYAWIAYYLVEHYQGANITEHINTGGEFYNWGRVTVVTIIGLVTVLAALVVVFYTTASVMSNEVINKYGTAQSEVHFDKTNMSPAEADKIGHGFMDIGLFGNDTQIFTYVKKNGNTYEISIPCNEKVKTDPQIAQGFTQLRTQLQAKFPQNKIIFKLVVDDLDNVVKQIE